MIAQATLSNILKLYRRVVTPQLVDATIANAGVTTDQRGGIFRTAVVVWLMIFQRLSGDHTLTAAIVHLQDNDLTELLLPGANKSIKARHRRISNNTGGYSNGRSRVSLSVVEQLTDVLNEELSKVSEKEEQRRIYSIDGTTLLIAHSEENVTEYSQHKTRLGVSHYPLTRVTIATNMLSGVATRPAIGAHNGSKSMSEIAQSHEVLSRLEKGSIVLADRLYGVTQVVHKTQELGLQFIVRLKDAIANRLTKSGDKECDMEILWRPSDYEQKQHPHLVGVEIPGRYICKTIRRAGFRPFKLRLFTTCDEPTAAVVALYGLRWNIEQDLRNLKTTLELNFINAKSPDMVAKEIITGVTAYNLVRHFMKVVAKQLHTSVRDLSFKGVLRRLGALELFFVHNSSRPSPDAKIERRLHDLLTDLKILKLPIRKNPRPSQPRQKWRKGVQRYRKSPSAQQVQS